MNAKPATVGQVEANYNERLQDAERAYNASIAQYDALTASATKDNRHDVYAQALAIYDAAHLALKNAKANAVLLYRIEMQNI